MPIETKIAPVGKSYSALDFQADVVVCVNGDAKVYKLPDNIEIKAVSRDLISKCSERTFPILTELHELLNVILQSLISYAGIPSSHIATDTGSLLGYRKLPWSRHKGSVFCLGILVYIQY